MNSKIILIAILLFSQVVKGQNQELITCSGNEYNNSSISISWSIGECLVETFNSNTNIISQGLHQGQCVITSINSKLEQSFNISVYPNPFKDNFNIDFSQLNEIKNITVKLINEKGATVFEKEINNMIENIALNQIPGQCYLMKIISNNKLLKTFKIIKSN